MGAIPMLFGLSYCEAYWVAAAKMMLWPYARRR
jgi:hypothetical protein